MKHTHAYIVEPIDGRYSNKKDVEGQELILNTSIEDHKFVNRSGIIIEKPIIKDKYDLQIGDEVIIHHNVFRRYYDMRGNEKNSRNYFEEDKYFCFSDQIFLYKRSGKWYTPPGFCFVKPIKSTNNLTEDKEEPLTGVLRHLGSDLKSFGLQDNDLIGFTPNSEYEFVIDNEKLYRVPLNSISIKYERKGTEVEYNTSWV
jgi:hypothetical protein